MSELACIEYASNVSSERVSECFWETTAASAVPSSRSCPCGRGWSGTARTLRQSPSDRERRSTTTPSELKCMPERTLGQLLLLASSGASYRFRVHALYQSLWGGAGETHPLASLKTTQGLKFPNLLHCSTSDCRWNLSVQSHACFTPQAIPSLLRRRRGGNIIGFWCNLSGRRSGNIHGHY